MRPGGLKNLQREKHHDFLVQTPGNRQVSGRQKFLKQSINQQRIPFEIVPPQENFSKRTLAAIEEAKIISRDPTVKSYSNAKELLEDCD